MILAQKQAGKSYPEWNWTDWINLINLESFLKLEGAKAQIRTLINKSHPPPKKKTKHQTNITPSHETPRGLQSTRGPFQFC